MISKTRLQQLAAQHGTPLLVIDHDELRKDPTLVSGCVAIALLFAINPDARVPMIGASGAIAGVMGAYFVLYPQSRVLTLIPFIIFVDIVELPAILLLGFWFVMQLVSAGAVAVTASTTSGGGTGGGGTPP